MNSKKRKKISVFAKRLAELRKSQHLTQEELAEKIGMSRSMIGYYEVSAKNPTLETLQKLSHLFSVSIIDLIEEPKKIGHRGPTSQLERQLEQIKKLPTTKQKIISNMLEGALKS